MSMGALSGMIAAAASVGGARRAAEARGHSSLPEPGDTDEDGTPLVIHYDDEGDVHSWHNYIPGAKCRYCEKVMGAP